MARSARVQLCGRFVLEWDGRPVEAVLPGRQGRLLAAYLVLRRPYPASRDALVDALWPARPPPNAGAAISALLSKIRSLLGAEHLTGRHEVCLVLPPDSRVDVEEAGAALHEAQSALALGDWPRAWPTSLTALFVTRRPLLNDVELPWVEDWRRRLGVVRVEALECYATACLRLGGTELPSAVRAARELVALAPLRESGHRTLMEALAAGGNVAEALTAYDALRRLLRDELGVPPSPQLQEAHARLLGSWGAKLAPTSHQAGATLPPAPAAHRVPGLPRTAVDQAHEEGRPNEHDGGPDLAGGAARPVRHRPGGDHPRRQRGDR